MAVHDSTLVLLEAFVPLELNARCGELIHGRADVRDGKVQDGVRGRLVVFFG